MQITGTMWRRIEVLVVAYGNLPDTAIGVYTLYVNHEFVCCFQSTIRDWTPHVNVQYWTTTGPPCTGRSVLLSCEDWIWTPLFWWTELIKFVIRRTFWNSTFIGQKEVYLLVHKSAKSWKQISLFEPFFSKPSGQLRCWARKRGERTPVNYQRGLQSQLHDWNARLTWCQAQLTFTSDLS